jgi:ankyrin repeat protein
MGTGEARLPQVFTIEQRLLEAVRQGDQGAIEKALEHGATVHAKDDLQRSTVLLAVLDAEDLELVKWLHVKGAALDEPDVGGRSPLSYAAAAGHLAMVSYLVKNGAEVDRRDMQQRTPLFHAALNDRETVIGYLLDNGAAVDARDQFADTPLIAACAKGSAAAAAMLIERGADPGLRDQEGRTARERAAPGTAPCLPPTPPAA